MTEQKDQLMSRRQFLKIGGAAAAALAVGGSLPGDTPRESDFEQEPDVKSLVRPYSEADMPADAETREEQANWNVREIVDAHGHKIVTWVHREVASGVGGFRFEFVWDKRGRVIARRTIDGSTPGKFDEEVNHLFTYAYNSEGSKRLVTSYLVAPDGEVLRQSQDVSSTRKLIDGKFVWSDDLPQIPHSQ